MCEMTVISGKTGFHIDAPSAVAIGKFDGVHLGHRKILSLITGQKERGLVPVVFTFEPSPDEFFSREYTGSLLTTLEKENALSSLGVEVLVEYHLNSITANISPESFLKDILKGQMNAQYVAAGEDVSFGSGGRGDFRLLTEMAPRLNMETEIVEKVMSRGETVSSTLIRTYLQKGDMERVSELMGKPYYVTGRVEAGEHRGRKLGFPTINVSPGEKKMLPPRGVYLSMTILDGREYPGITNLGVKPTFGDGFSCGTETFLYDFCEDVYGKKAIIELRSFVRKEITFDSPSALKERVDSDIERGREYFGL